MKLTRRTLLRGAGGAVVALPWLEAMAQAAESPKRLVIFYTKNGFYPDFFWPKGTESDFTLGRIMGRLQPYKDKLLVLRGLENKIATFMRTQANGNGHFDATASALTLVTPVGGITGGGGPSIDQYIGEHLGRDVRFKSIEYALGYANRSSNINFSGVRQPIPFQGDDQQLFDRLFTGFAASPDPAAARVRADRQSIIDSVSANLGLVQKRLGTADRERLDAHLTMTREFERRVFATPAATSGSCNVPGRPKVNASASRTDGFDMLAHALACDRTRVATIFVHDDQAVSQLGITGNYHNDWVHAMFTDPAAPEVIFKKKDWDVSRLVYFLDKLKSIPEGNGTVLDNTLVVWTDEFGSAPDHRHKDTPFVLISGSNRFFRPGRFLHYPDAPHINQVWSAILPTLGVPGPFGDTTKYPSASLPSIV